MILPRKSEDSALVRDLSSAMEGANSIRREFRNTTVGSLEGQMHLNTSLRRTDLQREIWFVLTLN